MTSEVTESDQQVGSADNPLSVLTNTWRSTSSLGEVKATKSTEHFQARHFKPFDTNETHESPATSTSGSVAFSGDSIDLSHEEDLLMGGTSLGSLVPSGRSVSATPGLTPGVSGAARLDAMAALVMPSDHMTHADSTPTGVRGSTSPYAILSTHSATGGMV
jgi:hypothetical protein